MTVIPILVAVLAIIDAPGFAGGVRGCEVVGTAVSVVDRERAQAGCDVARQRFGELFGEPVPPVRVEIVDRPGYRVRLENGTAVIVWSATSAMQVPGGGDAGEHAALQWRDVLPHETTHALLAAHFFPAGFGDHRGYGTPLPDWFEEAVAIWAESGSNRRGRLAQTRSLQPGFQNLGAILAMPHPGLAGDALDAGRTGSALPRDPALWAFYPQAIGVLAFVHDAGGPAAVRELADRLVAVPHDRDALAGLPGLPATMDAVTAAWRHWLARPAR